MKPKKQRLRIYQLKEFTGWKKTFIQPPTLKNVVIWSDDMVGNLRQSGRLQTVFLK
jgi:hypothetical protein